MANRTRHFPAYSVGFIGSYGAYQIAKTTGFITLTGQHTLGSGGLPVLALVGACVGYVAYDTMREYMERFTTSVFGALCGLYMTMAAYHAAVQNSTFALSEICAAYFLFALAVPVFLTFACKEKAPALV